MPPHPYPADNLKPLRSLKRKVILIPLPGQNGFWQVLDLYRPSVEPFLPYFDSQKIPPFPKKNDVVILGRVDNTLYVVKGVDADAWNATLVRLTTVSKLVGDQNTFREVLPRGNGTVEEVHSIRSIRKVVAGYYRQWADVRNAFQRYV